MDFIVGDGCRCCYDPNGDGGEYELLTSAREEMNGRRHDVDVTGGCDDDGEDGRRRRVRETDGARDDDDDDDSDDGSDDDEFDYLLDMDDVPTNDDCDDDHDDVRGLESRRRAELLDVVRRREAARRHGYGVHRQMSPSRAFAAVGYRTESAARRPPPRGSVLHLYDPHSSLSASMDLCLEDVAYRHPGTKFVRGHGVDSLPHADGGGGGYNDGWRRANLPMLLALRDGEVVCWSSGLRDFRSGDDVGSGVIWYEVERWLDRAGVLSSDVPPPETLCGIRPEEEALLDNMRKLNRTTFGGRPGGGELDDDDMRERNRYDCGVDGCDKSFYHEHVGVRTDAQDGLLVSESQVASSSPD